MTSSPPFFNDIDSLIATARSNKVATCLGIQDFSQLKKDYGADQSAVIMNITGNIISGQVTGETSKFLSERFGKINQVKESISINRTDTSVSKSSQLDFAIPQSKIAGFLRGVCRYGGGRPNNKIKHKTFHCEILNNHVQLMKETDTFVNLPNVNSVSAVMVIDNFKHIKKEVVEIIEIEIERILNTPGLDGILSK